MDDAFRQAIRDAVADDDAFFVGGCVRDAKLGRPVLDVDVACTEPAEAARRFRAAFGVAIFELSERHKAWRVLTQDDVTVDFVGLRGSIEDDLRLRDFTANSIARNVVEGTHVDPLGGLGDIEAGVLRAASDQVFVDDPLRLLRGVRLEDELPLAMDSDTGELVRAHAASVSKPAGERIVAELQRLSCAGFVRLDELGLLAELGGSAELLARLSQDAGNDVLLIATLREGLLRLPIPRELARMTRALLRAEPPAADDARSIHRFRRATEPWALEALSLLDAGEHRARVLTARASEPETPLLSGDELGLPPGPEIGRLLELIAEERAAGTITTRDDALALIARLQ